MRITKNNHDTAHRTFWKTTTEARTTVEGWPEWKRNLRITKYSACSQGKDKTK